jgi:sulfopyruvate decarboxylase TPP-binding subunit
VDTVCAYMCVCIVCVYERGILLLVSTLVCLCVCESVGETVGVCRGQLMARWKIVLIMKLTFLHENLENLILLALYYHLFDSLT